MIKIDTDLGLVVVNQGGEEKTHSIGSPEAFKIISSAWLRSGWDNKHVYSFTWLGRPIIQLPEDMFRLQEVIYSVKPDVIVETGIAHGGALVFYASLCSAMGCGKVVGIDIEIRPHNRKALEAHRMFSLITLIEKGSLDPGAIESVKQIIGPEDKVLVVLDSRHEKAHVLSELRAYSPFVSVGSYIIAMDGIMESVVGAPRTEADWSWNNPKQAAIEFVKSDPDFEIEEPSFLFNEGSVTDRVTYWPSGYIKRIR